MIGHLWQSTVFAGAAGLLTLALRDNRAQVRFWLWMSASLKFLVPFALLIGLGTRLELPPAAHNLATAEVAFTIERIAQPFPVALPPAPESTDWLRLAFLGVWACGFFGVVSIRLRGWSRIRNAVRAGTPLDVPVEVEVRSSPGLLEPGVVGFRNPVILVPEGIAEHLTRPELEAVLAHEMCHVRRRDNLFAGLHMVVEALFWFHPFVWWIGARLVEERERACDEAVLRLGNQPRIYADAILRVCRLYVESPLTCVSGVTGAGLKKRIEAIMKNRTGRSLNPAKKLLLAFAGIAAVMGPITIGVLRVAHAPAVHAQSPVAPGKPEAAVGAKQDHRLVAMLLGFGAMTDDEQSRTRESALAYVNHSLKPTDRLAILSARDGKIAIAQDFTDDKVVLSAAILHLPADVTVRDGLAGIEAAARLLAAFPDKKALIYFSGDIEKDGANHQAERQRAIDAAIKANVALYLIDTGGFIAWSPAPGGRSMTSPTPPAVVSSDEQSQRADYAREHFGSASSSMGRAYIRYGPPDQIAENGVSQIWRYNYLGNFRSNVELEFTPWNGHYNMRINWPPPVATYEGSPATAPFAAASANTIAGLPAQHALVHVYPAEEFQVLSIPLGALSGQVDIEGRILARSETGAAGPVLAAFRDSVQASSNTYQANFILPAGSYVCNLAVKEQGTGQTFGEAIDFVVK